MLTILKAKTENKKIALIKSTFFKYLYLLLINLTQEIRSILYSLLITKNLKPFTTDD